MTYEAKFSAWIRIQGARRWNLVGKFATAEEANAAKDREARKHQFADSYVGPANEDPNTWKRVR